MVADNNVRYTVKRLAVIIDSTNHRATLEFRGTRIWLFREGTSAQKTNRTHPTVFMFMLTTALSPSMDASVTRWRRRPLVMAASKCGGVSTSLLNKRSNSAYNVWVSSSVHTNVTPF